MANSLKSPIAGAQTTRAIVEAILHTKPAEATHWSVRTMAQGQGVSHATVHRIWQGIPERQTHDYKGHGTTTLFAALNISLAR
jgi:hypothetical protein